MTTTPQIRLVCPSCKNPDELWAAAHFEGWHAVDVRLNGRHRDLRPVRRGRPYYEVERDLAQLWGNDMGCSCGWTGRSSDLVQLGIDGQPLTQPLPGQTVLA